ncbi:hypothetical protein [Actinomadura violacea]|uniref:Secreted protein n=1 Tax=Actinomadura violacea TaxID=2819934 RepID=A0ABS3SA20_9ACTN|nr:hypothetical protein [Actinomadura violacea]MBO2465842.1 hypothetical protein [Actinomadura violacea]
MRKRTLFAAAALALATVSTAPGVASAASPASGDPGPVAQGRLILGSMSGPMKSLVYQSCATPAKILTTGTYTSYDNEPLTGCEAVLVNTKGTEYVLCNGRGTVPADFQTRPTVVIREGKPVLCP